MSFFLREAVPADAPALASVHTAIWRETYAGLMPPDFLHRMTDGAARERRTVRWAANVEDPAHLVLVAEQAGKVVAFASAGPPNDHPGIEAELYTLYALKAAHGQGLGRALLREVMARLLARGQRSLALWVLADNPTRGWYVRQGGREAGEKVVALPDGGELHEVRLVWNDLSATAAASAPPRRA